MKKFKILNLASVILFSIYFITLNTNMDDNSYRLINLNLLKGYAQSNSEDIPDGGCMVSTECANCNDTVISCIGYDNCFATTTYVQCDGDATYCPGNYGIPCS